MTLFDDFSRAINQFTDRRFLGVLAKALALTIALLFGVGFALLWGLSLILPPDLTLPFIGTVTFFDNLAFFAAIPVIIAASGLIMFPVAAVFVGLFLDEIAEAVEQRHYPTLPAVSALPISTVLSDGARFTALFLFANGVALIIYLVSTVLAPVIFWIVNGFLLGREYMHQVALRRMDPPAARALRRRHVWQMWAAGIILAIPLSIPILNLIIPILGVAVFTHLVERLRRTDQ